MVQAARSTNQYTATEHQCELTLPSLDVPATCPVAMVTMSGWMAKLQREHCQDQCLSEKISHLSLPSHQGTVNECRLIPENAVNRLQLFCKPAGILTVTERAFQCYFN